MTASDADKAELPPGWSWAALGELGKSSGGGTPSKANTAFWTNGTIPWISPKDMKSDIVGDVPDQITDAALESSAAKLIPEGSLFMVTRSGILNHTFPVAISDRPAVVNQDIRALTVYRGVSAHYVKRFLERENREIVQQFVKDGTTVASVDVDRLMSLPVPVAPSKEQERVVQAIDELFGEIEAGERELQRARERLSTYRRSVLKAAVTGELTRDWREANAPNELSADLLASILSKRRDAWVRRERSKMIAKGKPPKDDEWRARYVDPAAPDITGVPELPRGWIWVNVRQLCSVRTGATPRRGTSRYYEGGTIPWITSALVNQRSVSKAEQFITPDAVRETNAKVQPAGSILIALYGEGRTRGMSAHLKIDAATNQALAVLGTSGLPDPTVDYLLLFFDWFYEGFRAQAAGGVQPNLSLGIINATVIPLPPLAEQREIQSRVSDMYAVGIDVDRITSTAASEVSRLRLSTLSAAFAGRLVPQDPTDEPATTLFDRLRAQLSAAAKPRQKRKRAT